MSIDIEVTLHIKVPDSWADCDLTKSEEIINLLEASGIAEEITGTDDKIISARLIEKG